MQTSRGVWTGQDDVAMGVPFHEDGVVQGLVVHLPTFRMLSWSFIERGECHQSRSVKGSRANGIIQWLDRVLP